MWLQRCGSSALSLQSNQTQNRRDLIGSADQKGWFVDLYRIIVLKITTTLKATKYALWLFSMSDCWWCNYLVLGTDKPVSLAPLHSFGGKNGSWLPLTVCDALWSVVMVRSLALNSNMQLRCVESLSLAGRINMLNINIVPKFINLFQNIPIFNSKKEFKSLDRMFSNFIWDGKQPRISKAFLQRPKTSGGMSVPNLHYYYWGLQHSESYCTYPKRSSWAGVWLGEDRSTWSSFSLPLPLAFRTSHTNQVVAHTLKIWTQFRKLLKASLIAPIMTNHLFAPAQLDLSFRAWHGNGIRVIEDLYVEGIFASFAQLAEKFSLPQSHHFRYFQVRDFVRKGCHPFPELPRETSLDTLLATKTSLKGTITRIYGTLTNMNPQLTGSLGLSGKKILAHLSLTICGRQF